MSTTLLHGDCRDILPTLPAGSVQCVVTSPPYFGLRRYDVEGAQIGLEQTPAEYVGALVEVFREVRRVLRDDGVLWVNLGDSYAGSWGNYAPGGIKNQQRPQTEEGRRWERRAYGDTTTLLATDRVPGLAEKNLIGVPWRVAFALQDDGWILRSDIIWSKLNPMPESVTDRPTRAHEYLFLFAKSPRYYYDSAAIAEPISQSSIDRINQPTFDQQTGGPKDYANGVNPSRSMRKTLENFKKRSDKQSESGLRRYEGFNERWENERPQRRRALELAIESGLTQEHIDAIRAAGITDTGKAAITQAGTGKNTERIQQLAAEAKKALGGYYREFLSTTTRNRRTVWTVATRPYAGAHFAVFPEQLVEPCILAGSRPGDTVLDPFVGSGTTCRVAERFGRDSIGIDLGYQDLQEKRTDGVQKVMVELL